MTVNSGKKFAFLYLPFLAALLGGTLFMAIVNTMVLFPFSSLPVSTTCVILPSAVVIALMLAFNFHIFQEFESSAGRGSPSAMIILSSLLFTCTFQFWIGSIFQQLEPRPFANPFLLALSFLIPNLIWMLASSLGTRVGNRVANHYHELTVRARIEKLPEDVRAAFSYLIPQPRYRFIPVVLNINLAVALILLLAGVDGFQPEMDDLRMFGGAAGSLMKESMLQHWRLLTTGWIHISILSLASASAALVLVGRPAERILGIQPVAMMYLISLLIGHVASHYFHPDSTITGSSFGALGIAGGLFFYALFDVGDVDNRGIFLISSLAGVGAALLAIATESVSLGFFNAAGAVAAFVTGMIVAIYYISVAKHAASDET